MTSQQFSLWGEDFTIQDNTKVALEKIEQPKDIKKALKSSKVSLEDKLLMIEAEVNRILGKYKSDTVCLRSEEELVKYIDKAIECGVITVDTETNNTVDIFGDCKLMGLCLYVPGLKNAYGPVNHINRITEQLLPDQLTTEQIAVQLKRLKDSNVRCIFHNAPFDVEVLNRTCGVRLPIYWDTMVGAQMVDENEPKSLKQQYRLHLDSTQEKYDIEHLFNGLSYSIFPPELFALYAATDSYMTYKLYEYQKNILEQPELVDVYNLFKTIEIPVLDSVIDMESTGICVDVEYAKKMSEVYHKKSDEVQVKIDTALQKLQLTIDDWKQTPDAKNHPATNSKSGIGKSKAEKLSDPIDLGSPTQLAILLYDILKVPVVDTSTPRGTGADILATLAEEKHIEICKLIIEKRKVDILINTFIDAIPTYVKDDGRVHCRFNSVGAATGRFSSSNPNLQNIPSHDKLIRMIFRAACEEHAIEINNDNVYKVKYTDEVEISPNNWVKVKDITVGTKILNSEGTYDTVKNIEVQGDYYNLIV